MFIIFFLMLFWFEKNIQKRAGVVRRSSWILGNNFLFPSWSLVSNPMSTLYRSHDDLSPFCFLEMLLHSLIPNAVTEHFYLRPFFSALTYWWCSFIIAVFPVFVKIYVKLIYNYLYFNNLTYVSSTISIISLQSLHFDTSTYSFSFLKFFKCFNVSSFESKSVKITFFMVSSFPYMILKRIERSIPSILFPWFFTAIITYIPIFA